MTISSILQVFHSLLCPQDMAVIELIPLSSINQTPFPAFRLEDTTLVISGMGKVNPAMATAYGCIAYKPDHVLNFGAAGVTGLSASPGEIYQIGCH